MDERYSPPLSAYAIEEKWAAKERVGLFRFPSAATATGSTLMPWIRRQHKNETETEMAINDVTLVKVTSSTHTLEAFVYVAPSSVAGAGRGLFLRPRVFLLNEANTSVSTAKLCA